MRITILFALALLCSVSTSAQSPAAPAQTGKITNELEKIAARPAGSDLPVCTMKLHWVEGKSIWASCGDRLLRSDDGGLKWQEIYAAGQMHEYYFLSAQVIWLRSQSELRRSTDGGATWKPVTLPVARNSWFDSLKFHRDGRRGWLSVSLFQPCSPVYRKHHGVPTSPEDCHRAVLFSTNDGGLTWQHQPFTTRPEWVIDLKLTPDDRVWVVHAKELYALESGVWKKLSIKPKPCTNSKPQADAEGSSVGSTAMVDLFFHGPTGWLSLSDGYLLNSTDAGKTWCDLFDLKTLAGPPYYFFLKLHFADAKNGWGMSDRLFRTRDGGIAWSKIETPSAVEDMLFPAVGPGYVVTGDGIYRINP